MLKIFRKKCRHGFTLLELMIVMAIIGLLASIAAAQFLKYVKSGHVATLNTDARNAYTACQAYLTYNFSATTANAVVTGGYVKSRDVSISMNWTDQNNYTITISGDSNWALSTNQAQMIVTNGISTLVPAAI